MGVMNKEINLSSKVRWELDSIACRPGRSYRPGLSLHVSLRHECDHKSRPIFTRLRGELGQSEHRRMLGDSGNGGGSDSLALFGSTEHEGFVNSEKLGHKYR